MLIAEIDYDAHITRTRSIVGLLEQALARRAVR